MGNPGPEYEFSRHNLGFAVVEKLARANKIRLAKKVFNCLLGQGALGNRQVLLAEPLTFVNLSGQAALEIVKRGKIQPRELLVICDDVNLSLGKIRIRAGGSAGGHNGLRSIIEALERRDFPRLRIGVGRPKEKAEKDRLSRHVLGRFGREEMKTVSEAVEKAQAASELWVKKGSAAAMNQFN